LSPSIFVSLCQYHAVLRRKTTEQSQGTFKKTFLFRISGSTGQSGTFEVLERSQSCGTLSRMLKACLNIKIHHFNNCDAMFPRRRASRCRDVTLCSSAHANRSFGETCCLREAAGSFETLVPSTKLQAVPEHCLTTGWTVRDRIPVETRFSARLDQPCGPPSLL